MSQRTQFPALPNANENAYLEIVEQVFHEVQGQGGRVPFKKFRAWMKDHDIYDKETAEELFAFLGCSAKPEIVLGDFAARFLACKSKEAQQHLLYDWLMECNPFIIKYVFEALDVDSGGRLHSEHEMYRLLTSYVYAGEYITLVNFQNWLKWITASGYLRLIGIRWGLSESGKAELKEINKMDVEEMLEDEAESDLASVAKEAAPATPAIKAVPLADPNASELVLSPEARSADGSAPNSGREPEPDSADEPDMPPEAPVPDWTAPDGHPLADLDEASAPETPPVKSNGGNGSAKITLSEAPPKTTPASTAALPKGSGPASTAAEIQEWFSTFQGRQPDQASQLGLNAKQYGKNPPLFVYKMTVLSRLAVGSLPVSHWESLWRRLLEHKLLDEYFDGKRPLDSLLANEAWFQHEAAHRQACSSIAFELMRAKAVLTQGGQGLCDLLEDSADGSALIASLHERVFLGELTSAPFWMLREMFYLGIWDNPAFAANVAVPSPQARINACRLGLLESQYATTFESLCRSAKELAQHFPASRGGDYAMSYVHLSLDGPSLDLPFREQG